MSNKEMEVVKQETAEVVTLANALVIKTQDDFDGATELLKGVKTGQKKVDSVLDPQCKAAYKAWQTSNDIKKEHMAPLKEAEKIVKSKMGDFLEEQDRIREEAERKERERVEKAEAAERRKLEKKAKKAEEAGDEDKAEELREEAEDVFVAENNVETGQVEKAEGISTTKTYDVEVVDLRKLVKWAAKNRIDPASIFNVKVGGLKTYIKATGDKDIAGCKIRSKRNVSAKV